MFMIQTLKGLTKNNRSQKISEDRAFRYFRNFILPSHRRNRQIQREFGINYKILETKTVKARRRQTFKKPILVFPAPAALETPKSVS